MCLICFRSLNSKFKKRVSLGDLNCSPSSHTAGSSRTFSAASFPSLQLRDVTAPARPYAYGCTRFSLPLVSTMCLFSVHLHWPLSSPSQWNIPPSCFFPCSFVRFPSLGGQVKKKKKNGPVPHASGRKASIFNSRKKVESLPQPLSGAFQSLASADRAPGKPPVPSSMCPHFGSQATALQLSQLGPSSRLLPRERGASLPLPCSPWPRE